jgi:hypothetical protein
MKDNTAYIGLDRHKEMLAFGIAEGDSCGKARDVGQIVTRQFRLCGRSWSAGKLGRTEAVDNRERPHVLTIGLEGTHSR